MEREFRDCYALGGGNLESQFPMTFRSLKINSESTLKEEGRREPLLVQGLSPTLEGVRLSKQSWGG